MTPPPPLRELETEVMDAVWDLRAATVRQVGEELARRGSKERAYTTIMTICSRLAGKAMLSRTREGQTDVYEPMMTRDAYREARAAAGVAALVDEAGDLALVHFAKCLDTLDPERREALELLARGGA